MGTRADFYVMQPGKKTLEQKDWIGSIAWDGYPEGIPDEIKKAQNPKDFKAQVKKFLKSRDDATFPKDGWPWPWNDTGTTDYGYVFVKNKVSWRGRRWPDMSNIKSVASGKRSGILVFVR